MPAITTTYQGDMAFETVLGRHRLLIDVPAAMGGQDRGPTPPELFVASLGSCVAAFVPATASGSAWTAATSPSRSATTRPPTPPGWST
jgi:uncharacterized OsmC-like protein